MCAVVISIAFHPIDLSPELGDVFGEARVRAELLGLSDEDLAALALRMSALNASLSTPQGPGSALQRSAHSLRNRAAPGKDPAPMICRVPAR